MTTDDDVTWLVGKRLVGFEVKNGPNVESWDSWNTHEQQFLELKTDQGSITFVTHNSHNGYYGGFKVVARVLD